MANLSVNLVKGEFCHGTVEYMGHIVGQGQIKPLKAKVEAIISFPVPKDKKELMRFLGMDGYYRKLCSNCSTIAHSLINLLGKDKAFVWSEKCQKAFESVTLQFSKP